MKYEPDWVKGREDMLWTRDLRRTDRPVEDQMDRQTDHYSTPEERALIIIPLNIFYVKLHENYVIQSNSEIVSMISARGEKSMKLFTGGI